MKLSAGKKAAIKNNRGSGQNKKNRRKSRFFDNDRFVIAGFAVLFTAMAVFTAAKAAARRDVSNETPENYYKVMNNFQNEIDDVDANPNSIEGMPMSMINEPMPISCWGDSFTLSADESIPSYAGIMAVLKNRTIYNIAAAEDSLVAVAGREGGIPLMVTPFIIPNDKTPVEIIIDNADGERMYLDFHKNAGLNPCVINGVEGMISKMNDKLFFTRAASGDRMMITEPSAIETRGMELRRDDITVFFVGSDEIFSDPAKTVKIYRKMADSLGSNDKYIVMSPVIGDRATLEAVENAMEAEFGEKFVNTRKLVCQSTDRVAEIYEVSEDGVKQANNGDIPAEYFFDENYFSEKGSYAVGLIASDALENLGYLADAPAVPDEAAAK